MPKLLRTISRTAMSCTQWANTTRPFSTTIEPWLSIPSTPMPTAIEAVRAERRASTIRPSATTTKPWLSILLMLKPSTIAEMSGSRRANTTRLWPTTTKPWQFLVINPNDANAYTNRGNAWLGKGDYDKAISDYNNALTLDPKNVAAYDNLAWLQATCPDEKYRDGKKAVENATKAYQLGGGQTLRIFGTLAAAYAESGDFYEAKEWGKKAVDMATAEKEKAEARSRLELYKQGNPYHEESKEQ